MQILYYSPTIWGNTDFYRTTGVFPFINHKELILRDISHFGKISQWDLYGANAIIVQRPCTPDHLALIKLAKQCGLKVIVDYDDDVLNVDQYSPVYTQYQQQRSVILECLSVADMVWVTTKSIQESFGVGVIIPNALNDYLLGRCAEYNENSNRVVWRGGSSHEADMYENADKILEMVRSNPGIDFFFIGHRFTYLEQRLGDNFNSVEGMPILQYFDYLKQLKPKAMIFPLCDTKLNRAKSNISWIEATWSGAEYFGNKDLPEFNIAGMNEIGNFPAGNGHAESKRYIEENLLLSKINDLRIESLLSL